MSPVTHEPLNPASDEAELLAELLEAARAKLLIEIRRTDHRAFRDELRRRLNLLENLIDRFAPAAPAQKG